MNALSLELGASGSASWWAPAARLAADFINQRYMLEGNPVAVSDALSFARSSTKWGLDSAGFWRQFTANQLALTDIGLSIEPAATNIVPNPGMVGAAPGLVGAGGSLPTGWFQNGALTTEVVALTELVGLPALHLRLSGVASGTFYELSLMPAATAIAAAATHTASVFFQLLTGAMPVLQLRQANASDGQVASHSLASGAGPRWAVTVESHASTVQGRIRFGIVTVVGQSYAVELVVACPQIEAGSIPSSPVLAPRAADALSLNLPGGSFAVSALHAGGWAALSSGSGTYSVSTSLSSNLVREIRAVPL